LVTTLIQRVPSSSGVSASFWTPSFCPLAHRPNQLALAQLTPSRSSISRYGMDLTCMD